MTAADNKPTATAAAAAGGRADIADAPYSPGSQEAALPEPLTFMFGQRDW
jgi:hypothetical protein